MNLYITPKSTDPSHTHPKTASFFTKQSSDNLRESSENINKLLHSAYSIILGHWLKTGNGCKSLVDLTLQNFSVNLLSSPFIYCFCYIPHTFPNFMFNFLFSYCLNVSAVVLNCTLIFSSSFIL